MAAPPVVKFLDFGQYKYELTKREKEEQAQAALGHLQGGPPLAEDRRRRLRHEGPPGDRVPRGRRPDQGDGPLPGPGADPPGDRSEPDRPVHGPDQGTRSRGTDAAARGQVDAHHDGIAPQAQGATRRRTEAARRPRARRTPRRRRRRTAPRTGTRRPERQPRRGAAPADSASTGRGGQAGARPEQRPAATGQPRRRQPRAAAAPAPEQRHRPPAATTRRPPPAPDAGTDRRVRPAVPKIKSHKAAQKRIGVTGSGKVIRVNAWRGHHLEIKSSRRTRRYAGKTS